MLTYKEINEFLSSFNSNSYNRSQIGNNKQLIINIYDFLSKLNITKENADLLINNIAYLNKDGINISLYLELLSKSLGFINTYELKEVINVVKEIHDIYYKSSANIPLEEYLHDTTETRIKKLFLNRNNKYLMKNFESDTSLSYLADLKLAAAIALSQKEYKEFIGYIDNYEMYQDSYSPILTFKTYSTVRLEIKEEKRLFWDILFANEYMVALTKHNIPIKDIYKKNIFKSKKSAKKVSNQIPIQLDLFSYEEAEVTPSIKIDEDINVLQTCTIYNTDNLIDFEQEKDLLLYFEKLLNNKEMIILPKLKNKKAGAFIYEMN